MGNIRKSPAACTFIIGVITALMMIQTAMGDVSRTGLVAEWHFDGNAKDSSGNGIDGTLYGATFADGKFRKGLSFNGINDYADFGEGGGKLDFGTGPFSIEFWINYKGTTLHPNGSTIIGKSFGGSDTPGFMAWTSTWFGDGSNYGLIIITSTAPWGESGGSDWGKYYPNNWYHVVLVRDGNTYIIYKNGDYSHSETSAGNGLNVNNDASLKIGDSEARPLTPLPYFNGLIDEVRIYNRALNANEVKTNYEAGQIIITSSPSGAEVLVNGQSKGIASPALSVYGVSPGTHSIKCRLSGYQDYDANIVLTAGSTASIDCTLKLAPSSPTVSPVAAISPSSTITPILSISKEPFSFNTGNIYFGESSSHIFTISNDGGGNLTWTVSADQPWITLSPTSGTNSEVVKIRLNSEALDSGTYFGTITVSSNGGTKKGSVTMNILPGTKTSEKTSNNTPQLFVSPDPFTFNSGAMTTGESGSNIFSISNAGGGNLIWSVIDDQSWITINPTSGTDSGTITLNINTAGLNPGSYSGTITVNSNGGTKKGSVLLVIPQTPIPTPTTTSQTAQPVILVQIMGVILVLAGILMTTLTTFKKDVSIEFGISERNLKYVGGTGIILVIIGAYTLLKSTLPII